VVPQRGKMEDGRRKKIEVVRRGGQNSFF